MIALYVRFSAFIFDGSKWEEKIIKIHLREKKTVDNIVEMVVFVVVLLKNLGYGEKKRQRICLYE